MIHSVRPSAGPRVLTAGLFEDELRQAEESFRRGWKSPNQRLEVVIALAQASRGSEKESRESRRSGLQDSDSFEQNDDMKGLLHPQENTDGDAQPVTHINVKRCIRPLEKVEPVVQLSIRRFRSGEKQTA